jgi:hypothetical protein
MIRGLACATLAWNLCTVTAASASQPVSPVRIRHAQIRSICRPPAPGHAACTALLRTPVAASTPAATSAASTTYTVNDGASSGGPAGGLTPEQLASAYSYEPSSGGAGQTVAIVDAFDDPAIEEDLAEFDSHYGLAACTTADGCFAKVGQTGSPESLPPTDTTGWSVEITLDVETVHSVCPNCKILLVEADSSTYEDLAAAVNTAASMGATEVSNSYAGPEAGLGAAEQAAYSHAGVVIAAASGDDGYDDWDVANARKAPAEMPDTPASLPSVVAVGGTSLQLNSDGTRAAETVWNGNGPGDAVGLSRRRAIGATGGGCSTLFSAPLWQQSAPGFAAAGCGTKRLAADVAAVADPDTGFDIFDTYNCGPECKAYGIGSGSGWVTLGGTSLSTPLISSLYALAGGAGGVSDSALTLYGHLSDASALFDVTEGGSGFCDGEAQAECAPPPRFGHVDCEGTSACNATAGFDGPSGVGAPNGLGAFKPLFPTAVIAAPNPIVVGARASFSAEESSDPYPGGSIAHYAWEWGDGSTGSDGTSPASTHTFAAAGSYPVTLVVTDNYGLTSATVTRSVVVGAPSPEEEAAKQLEEATAKGRQEAEERAIVGGKPEEVKAPLTGNLQEVAAFHAAIAAAVPDAELASTALVADSSGHVVLEISCPVRESSCEGTVTLRTLAAVSAGTNAVGAASRGAAILTLAKGTFTLAGGKSKKLTLRLSTKARTLLARSHALRVRATIAAHDPTGASHTSQRTATLHLARMKHGIG